MLRKLLSHPDELEVVGRVYARLFVIFGGVFWVLAAFAGPYVYGEMSLADSVENAMWPLVATMVTLIVGWAYERLAAVMLFAGASAVVVWGALYAWEPGVWLIMAVVLIAPMAVAGALFGLATRSETRRATRAAEAERELASPANETVDVSPAADLPARAR